MKVLLALLLPCMCVCSEHLSNLSHDNVTNNITITNNSPAPSPRQVKVLHASSKQANAETAQEELIRTRVEDDDDFVTCCCFFKMKKLPLR